MMTAFSKVNKRHLLCLATLFCIIVAGSTSALAVPKAQVMRITTDETHTGNCCSPWGEAIRVNEPQTLVPIVVTWSTDYQSNAPFFIGLRLNHGPCTFYGPRFAQTFTSTDDTFASKTFQWVIMPGDFGLVKGQNSIGLCGGGVFAETDTIVLGFNTLAARLGK